MFIAALVHTSVYIGTYFHGNYKCTAATVVTLFHGCCMEGNIGGGKHWQIDSFQAFGER